jgi:hypothetical protein
MHHPLPDPETLYTALLHRDSTFEGIFVVGVKTTGVFCRPTCRARMPKRENVEFFGSAHEALSHGYRPCKICTPLEYKGAPPTWLRPQPLQIIPIELRGRTFALLRTLMQGATPLGGAMAGFLLPVVGMQMIIALASLVIGAPGLAGMRIDELRQAGSEVT